MENKENKELSYITEAEASALTGYKRTTLYHLRTKNSVRWTTAISGRKVRYHKNDLLKAAGIPVI